MICVAVADEESGEPSEDLHYIVYHAARRLLLLYPHVVVVLDKDLENLAALQEQLRLPPFRCCLSSFSGSFWRHCRQLYVQVDRLSEVKAAQSRVHSVA